MTVLLVDKENGLLTAANRARSKVLDMYMQRFQVRVVVVEVVVVVIIVVVVAVVVLAVVLVVVVVLLLPIGPGAKC